MINNLIRNFRIDSDFALVINWKFHLQQRWVSAFTKYLVNAIIEEFNPLIITNQFEYNINKKKIKYLISMEPGWAAPKLKYDVNISCKKAVFYSDPHFRTKERYDYFDINRFDLVYSFYYRPFFNHFIDFPVSKFVHFPWAVPDDVFKPRNTYNNVGEIAIFGGSKSEAYDMRNWCRMQKGVVNYHNSGVENKNMSDKEYFIWLQNFEAIIAAGSTNPKYGLVTPKYFEIMGSGALLVGQYCADYDALGFNDSNSVCFSSKEDFIKVIKKYSNHPDEYIEIRKNGYNHILENHTISKRINLIKETMYGL